MDCGMMTYDEALAYIHSVNWRGSRPGLSRITALLDQLGHPERALHCIHIAGTNGKGSTSAMLSTILREAGYSVGTFTSPFIESFNERIMKDDKPIGNDDLCRLLSLVAPIAEAMDDPPTEFELITALGFLYFKETGCDIVVLEVGMGGRLDSTNVIEKPCLSVITGVSLDHMAVLGDTVELIAKEKAGIIKEGCPVLYGGDDPVVQEILEREALQKNAPFFVTDRSTLSVRRSDLYGSVFDFGGYRALSLSLAGLYQTRNAATVLTAVSLLRREGLSIPDTALRSGLEKTVWRARFEVISKEPLVIFDGSHNMEGIMAARESIAAFFGNTRILLLTGVMADKAYEDMAEILVPHIREVFTVTPDNPRALDSSALAEVYRKAGVGANAFDSVRAGVRAALIRAHEEKTPLVALGSLYMYGEVKSEVKALVKELFS